MLTTFSTKYKVLDQIGEGSFSEVLKCQDRTTGELFAAKRLKNIYYNVTEILECPEVIAMRKISRHQNVLYMVDMHHDPLPGKVTLIFELMDLSLYDLMKNRKGRMLTEQRAKHYLYQLLKGLDHLHKHGIFHRDIKPENILLKGNVVKLGDLGSIRGIYSNPPYTEYISTRWYRSPECLLTSGYYGPKMDVWATGCVYYELLTLKPLFPGSNEVDQITKIHRILGTPHARLVAKFRRFTTRNCDFLFPTKQGTGIASLIPQVSEECRDILRLMLIYDPENRSNVKRLLEHRYFGDFRENEVLKRSKSTTAPCNEPNHWRNPVLLSYLTSDRRRRLKPCLSQRGTNKPVKIPRNVESTPNTTRSMLPPKLDELFDFQNSNRTERTEKTLKRYFFRKRTSVQEEPDTSDCSNTKLPNIRHSDKGISKKSNVVTNSSKSLSSVYPPYKPKEEKKPMYPDAPRNSCDSLKNVDTSYDFHTASMNILEPRRMRLATIRERHSPATSACDTHQPDSPLIKSPLKKIAKHEAVPETLERNRGPIFKGRRCRQQVK